MTDFGLSTSSNLNSISTSSAGGRGTIYFKASALTRTPARTSALTLTLTRTRTRTRTPQRTRAWEVPPAGLLLTAHACSNRRTARARTQAPELFAYPPVVSAAADVYAFAILAWVVCTREQPYQKLQSAETAMAAMLLQATPTPTPDLPKPLPLPLPLPDLYNPHPKNPTPVTPNP